MKYVNERSLFAIMSIIFAIKALNDATVFMLLFEDALISALCVYVLKERYDKFIKGGEKMQNENKESDVEVQELKQEEVKKASFFGRIFGDPIIEL